ncbi:OPI10 family protein [Candidatus Bathyarchaeota archaeon]|nr:OPI10 family protein [Candidatus Bathyarchaeota archaeon]
MSTPAFGIIPTGCPVQTEPASTPTSTSFLYALPASRSFSHVVVFLLPGVELPPDTAAAIYLTTQQEAAAAESSGRSPNFKFLGGIGPGKESSVFKISGSSGSNSTGASDAGSDLVIGVSIEPATSVSARMMDMPSPKPSTPATSSAASSTPAVVLAQKIIQSAFNFLSGFSGNAGPDQIEVVPLKAFEEWWRKYEGRLRNDPGFLDREG